MLVWDMYDIVSTIVTTHVDKNGAGTTIGIKECIYYITGLTRVKHVIILLLCAKCFDPARANIRIIILGMFKNVFT